MKYSFIFIAMMAYSSLAYSQSNNSNVAKDSKTVKTKQDNSKVYDVVEKMPSFPGGQKALLDYLNKNVKYPAVAERKEIQGRVVVQYIVGKDGSISDVKVAKSVHPLLDAEAVRVVESMPNWIPGERNGNPITVRYTIPITFRLNDSKKEKKKNEHYDFDSDKNFY